MAKIRQNCQNEPENKPENVYKNIKSARKQALFLFGGGEGSRTPVRRSVNQNFSERSRRTSIPLPASPAAGQQVR